MTTNFYSTSSCFSSCCLAIEDINEPTCHHLPFLCVLMFQNTMTMTSKCLSSSLFSCSTLNENQVRCYLLILHVIVLQKITKSFFSSSSCSSSYCSTTKDNNEPTPCHLPFLCVIML